MANKFSINFKPGGVLTNATSVTLASEDGLYGIKKESDNSVIVANNTAMSNPSTGNYSFESALLLFGVEYVASVKIVYNGQTTYNFINLIFTESSDFAANLLADVKIALRISGVTYDDEITDLILAAQSDLQLSGLLGEKIIVTDALIKRAVTLYCKANFGYNNSDADRLQKSYDMLKNHMSLSLDYAYYAVTFTVKNSLDAAIIEAEIVFDGVTKYTNSSGIAIFYVRSGDNYEYAISHEDYADYVDSDGDNYKVDISASTAISITMTS